MSPGAPPSTASRRRKRRRTLAPEVLLLGEGELDDFVPLLHELGMEPRHTTLAETVERTERASLLVASASMALALGRQWDASDTAHTSIAVTRSSSRTLGAFLRRGGFDYRVRLPVHPGALRLLLLGVLHRGDERRGAVRLPAGCEVTWRRGWRRRRGTLLELSRGGARLLAIQAAPVGTKVDIVLPSGLGGWLPLRLPGRVRRLVSPGPDCEGSTLAIVFDRLKPRAKERLECVLAELMEGPVPLPSRERRDPEHPRPWERDTEEFPIPDLLESDPQERRSARRSPFAQEVVQLDDVTRGVRAVLVGCDLSAGGLRIEPHPEIGVGDLLKLAIYDRVRGKPLVVLASVVRDDGPRGLGLRFDGVEAETTARIEQMIASEPVVQDLAKPEADAGHVILAEILDDEPGEPGEPDVPSPA